MRVDNYSYALIKSFYCKQDGNILMACAHEYTKSNLAFARALFPEHPAIVQRYNTIEHMLAEEGASIPCRFDLEHDTNPFLLALSEPYRTLLGQRFNLASHDEVSIIGALRAAKDAF